MIQVLTTPGPEGLTQIQWIEKYHYDRACDVLRQIENILSHSPVMHRSIDRKTVEPALIMAQVAELDLERIRAVLQQGSEMVAAGYTPPDHK